MIQDHTDLSVKIIDGSEKLNRQNVELNGTLLKS